MVTQKKIIKSTRKKCSHSFSLIHKLFFVLSPIFFCRSLSADYFGFQPYYDQFCMEPIDVPGKFRRDKKNEFQIHFFLLSLLSLSNGSSIDHWFSFALFFFVFLLNIFVWFFHQCCSPRIRYTEYINSEDEDYSLSLSAVIQRRASVRGRKKGYYSPRRASSPMGHVSGVCGIPAGNSIAVSKADRRRSSVYTTSSGE